MKTRLVYAATLLLCLTLTSVAWGQWSSDPAVNLPLADKTNGNDQVQPKLKPLPGNGWYVSWFDSDPNIPPRVGYDVRIQRLSPGGVELLPHDGALVATESNSSTEDYGLDIDTSGNALLAFLDTREGSNQQITATKVNRGASNSGDTTVCSSPATPVSTPSRKSPEPQTAMWSSPGPATAMSFCKA